jgi:ribosomal protein L37AE/L43A
MPFIKMVKPSEEDHNCQKPTSIHKKGRGRNRYAAGTIWECPKCKQQWVVVDKDDDRAWEKYYGEID